MASRREIERAALDIASEAREAMKRRNALPEGSLEWKAAYMVAMRLYREACEVYEFAGEHEAA